MPPISRIFIKAGILFMVLSLLVASLVAAPQSLGLPTWTKALTMTHFHLFVVGWITQIIFGVALWLFPKWSKEQPRGPEWAGWLCFGALNLGLVLRAISETAYMAGAMNSFWSWTMTLAAILQWLSALIFALLIWPRLKGRK